MTTNKIIRLAVVAAAFCGFTMAQAPSQDADNAPGRGVARISLINGDVSVRRGDSGDWTAAAVNGPLVVEDRVLTGPGSRTELQFDWSNMLRVSANAEVRMAELEYQRFMVQLAKGTVTWRVLRDQDAYVEISTPSVSVRPVKKGIYRVTVLEDGSSEITVRSGEAEIFTPRRSERLKSGRTMFARDSAQDPEFRVGDDIPHDDWDRWNESRDRDLNRSQSYSYVSRDIYGADDLDAHGRWVYISGYGWVWTPRVATGWAPYRSGRWVWVDWYGWSWVSYDPWGWAPYHYGRWFYNAPYGWCWYPGGMHVRHRWAPAYVAFFGYGGPGVSVGFGWGRVGWVPLAPYEPFHPWWGSRYYGSYRNPGYVNNSVTVVNNVNVTNVYRNSRVVNGTTVIDGDGFRRGRSGEAGRFSDADWKRVSVAQGPVPVSPDRSSLRMADRDVSVRPANPSGNDRFFSARQPSRVDRVSFADQQRGSEQFARRAWDGGGSGTPATAPAGQAVPAQSNAGGGGWRNADSGRQGTAAAPPTVRTERSEDSNRGWRPAGEGRQGATSPASSPATSGDTGGGWSRFGSARVEGRESGRGASAPAASGAGTTSSPRFGDPAAATPGQSVAPGRSSGGSSDGWTRFGSRSGGRESTPSSGQSAPSAVRENRSDRYSGGGRSGSAPAPSVNAPDPGSSRRSIAPSGGGGESIRISPPMVRERSSAPSSGSSSFGGGGRSSSGNSGGGHSTPSASPGRSGGGGSAPSHSSGGGGGGGRSGSSGSGGGRGR